MNEKIGRNDPCPCGSGKKYKKCCILKDNIVSGELFNEDAMSAYQAMLDNWDMEQGSPPTFMEYMGKSNLATDSLKDLSKQMESLNSFQEYQKQIDGYMHQQNNRPIDDFLGLSPAQMKTLLDGTIDECTEIFELNKNLDPKSVMDAPAFKQCHFLLNKIGENEKGIKATQKGNLPLALVKEFYEKYVKDNSYFNIKPRSEENLKEIQKAKYFLRDSGFVKFRNGRYSLTIKGSKLLNDFDPVSFYFQMLYYFIEKYNWLYGTGYDDHIEFIQFSSFFSLYIMKLKAKDFCLGDELADSFIQAFPHLSEPVRGNRVPQIQITSAFCYLFCEDFGYYLGLFDMKIGEKTFYHNGTEYKTKRLFDELFIWKV